MEVMTIACLLMIGTKIMKSKVNTTIMVRSVRIVLPVWGILNFAY